jgi:hypothetical protein
MNDGADCQVHRTLDCALCRYSASPVRSLDHDIFCHVEVREKLERWESPGTLRLRNVGDARQRFSAHFVPLSYTRDPGERAAARPWCLGQRTRERIGTHWQFSTSRESRCSRPGQVDDQGQNRSPHAATPVFQSVQCDRRNRHIEVERGDSTSRRSGARGQVRRDDRIRYDSAL